MRKPCKVCHGKMDRQGARGMCHRCYERWRYKTKSKRILAVNKESYLRHKEERLKSSREYRAQHLKHLRKLDREYYWKNKKALQAYQREYKKLNKEKLHNAHLLRMFGITHSKYEEIFDSQDRRCAICNKPESKKDNKRFAIDHNRRTGKIRGILCNRCNLAIGLLNDHVFTLFKAGLYLMRDR